MPAYYEVGLAALLPDRNDEHPGGMCRDELLFTIVDRVANRLLLDDYELREVLNADLPMACGSDDDVGDLVVMARSDNVGGVLSPERAKPMLDALAALGTSGEVPDPIAKLIPAERAILLPPPAYNTVGEFGADHVLRGAEFRALVDVLQILEHADLPQLEHARKLFAYCRDNRFPVSFVRSMR